MSYTARLKLPLIHSGQAQKEITHNEALTIIDVLLHPIVQAIRIKLLPKDAKPGELFIISENPEGDFATHANKIAAKLEYGWQFIVPLKWLEVTLEASGEKYQFNGNDWVAATNTLLSSSQTSQIQQPKLSNDYLIKKDTGEYLEVMHLQEDVKLQGLYTDTQLQIPHHSIVLCVNVIVLEAISGTSSFSVGIEGATNRYGSNLSSNQNTTNLGLTDHPLTFWQDTKIRITANNGSFTSGRARVTVQLLKPHGPWEWD